MTIDGDLTEDQILDHLYYRGSLQEQAYAAERLGRDNPSPIDPSDILPDDRLEIDKKLSLLSMRSNPIGFFSVRSDRGSGDYVISLFYSDRDGTKRRDSLLIDSDIPEEVSNTLTRYSGFTGRKIRINGSQIFEDHS